MEKLKWLTETINGTTYYTFDLDDNGFVAFAEEVDNQIKEGATDPEGEKTCNL